MSPVWVASYVIGLAMNTGWTEEFVLWELPLSRGLQYQHAILYANGAKTVPSESTMEAELARLERSLGPRI
jgi:hypothetical protein